MGFLRLGIRLGRILGLGLLVGLGFSVCGAQTLSSVSVSPSSVAGGSSATGVVLISKKAGSGGVKVYLASSSAAVVVTGNVVVAAGATKATFPVSTLGVAANLSAKITATYGSVSKVASLTVKAPTLVSVAISPSLVVAGDQVLGTVSVKGDVPSAGLTVKLSSSSPAASVPGSVTITSGNTSVSFLVSTNGVSAATKATIKASVGSSTESGSVSITPASLAALSLSPSTILGGSQTTATVALDGLAPAGGLSVAISDSSPTTVKAPKAVTIPAGASSTTFSVTALPVGASQTVVISASAAKVGISARLSVVTPQLVSVAAGPATVIGGTPSTGTVTISEAAPFGGCTVKLSSNLSTVIVPGAVTIPAGAKSATFVISTVSVFFNSGATITATLSGETQTCMQFVDLSPVLAVSPWPKFHGNNQNSGVAQTAGAVGTLLWGYQTGNIIGASSPVIDSNYNIYVGSNDFNFYALNFDGSLKWAFPTGGTISSSGAIGRDGTIYFTSTDRYLYALNPNGTLKWKFQAGGFGNSSPAIGADGTIYIGSGDYNVYALNPDGSMKWAFNIGNVTHSSPAIGPDGTVYVGSQDNVLYAITPEGSLKWGFVTGDQIISSPAVGWDGTVYVGSQDRNLYAIYPDGELKWSFSTQGVVWSSPAVGLDGTVYVGSGDGNLYAVNPDGSKKWSYSTGNSIINSSPAIGADGTIYVGSRDNYLYALNPSGSLQWRFLTGGTVDSSPAVGNVIVYVGSNDGKVYAIK